MCLAHKFFATLHVCQVSSDSDLRSYFSDFASELQDRTSDWKQRFFCLRKLQLMAQDSEICARDSFLQRVDAIKSLLVLQVWDIQQKIGFL